MSTVLNLSAASIPGFYNTFVIGGNLIRKQHLETKANPAKGQAGGKLWGMSLEVAGLGQTFSIFVDPKDAATVASFNKLETGATIAVRGEFRQMMGQVKTCALEVFDAKGASLMKC